MIVQLFVRDHFNFLLRPYQISSSLNSIILDRQNSWIKWHYNSSLERDFLVVAAFSARNGRTCRFPVTLLNCAVVLRCICVIVYISLTMQALSPYLREKISYFEFYPPIESCFKQMIEELLNAIRNVCALCEMNFAPTGSKKVLLPNMVAFTKFG